MLLGTCYPFSVHQTWWSLFLLSSKCFSMMFALLEEKGIKVLGPGRQSFEFVDHKSSQNIISRCLLYTGWHYVQGTGDRWRSTQNGSKIKFNNHQLVHRSHSKQKILKCRWQAQCWMRWYESYKTLNSTKEDAGFQNKGGGVWCQVNRLIKRGYSR